MATSTEKSLHPDAIPVIVEFSGGLELLFGGQRKHHISLPARATTGDPTNVDHLVEYLCKSVMTDERKDMFVLDNTVRPGVLVLINDADWELEGEGQYQIKPGDNILFVSTLHGG